VSARSYRQYCGLARALDVLGERWTLLVVRELALGPKRFRDLLDHLPGIGTNLLAARLKTLEGEGVIRRTTLPPPAGVHVYELTERGRGLEPALAGLAMWGFDLLSGDPAGSAIRASWAALSMRAVMEATGPHDVRGSFAFEVDGERFSVESGDGGVRVTDGPPPGRADVTARTDVPTFVALASGELTPARAVREKRLRVEGDRRLLDRLLAVFRLPARAAAA